MPIKSKKVRIHDTDIHVSCVRVNDMPPAYKFTATHGGHTHEHTHTMGANDGGVSAMTKELMQQIIDDARLKTASHVHLKQTVHELEDSID